MKKTKRKNNPIILGRVSTVLLLVVVAFLISCGNPEGTPTQNSQDSTSTPIKMILSTHESSSVYHSTDILQPWIAEVEERSGGRIQIEAHYNSELVEVWDAYDALQKGTIDLAFIIPHSIVGKFPMNSVAALCPFDNEGYRLSRLIVDLYNQFPEFQAEYEGIQPLYFQGFPSYVGTANKPISTLADGKGLKMIMAGEWSAKRAAALGWVTVDAVPPEVYGMFQTGVADGGGILALGDLVGGFRWGEVIKYVTLVPMNRLPTCVCMNGDKFNSLPADLQTMLTSMMYEYADIIDKVENDEAAKNIAAAKNNFGIEFINLSENELDKWMEADKSVEAEYIAALNAAGLPGEEFYNTYIELEKKYSDSQYQFK